MGGCQYEWVVMRKFIKYKDVYMVSSVGEVWKIENNK